MPHPALMAYSNGKLPHSFRFYISLNDIIDFKKLLTVGDGLDYMVFQGDKTFEDFVNRSISNFCWCLVF